MQKDIFINLFNAVVKEKSINSNNTVVSKSKSPQVNYILVHSFILNKDNARLREEKANIFLTTGSKAREKRK